jgi:hypothetical protein
MGVGKAACRVGEGIHSLEDRAGVRLVVDSETALLLYRFALIREARIGNARERIRSASSQSPRLSRLEGSSS